jgi:Protein of unknown function (DUF2975)
MRKSLHLSRSPLEPISTTVGIITALVAVFMILSLLLPQQTWGNGPVCTSVSFLSVPGPQTQAYHVAVSGLASGSQATINDVAVCADHPGTALRLAGLLMSWPSLVLLLGALALVRRLLKAAGRPGGLYALDTARRVRFLGWFLAAGALAAGGVESVAQTAVLTGQIHYPGINWFSPDQWHLSAGALLVGLALITLARVMRIGVTMREELDATV